MRKHVRLHFYSKAHWRWVILDKKKAENYLAFLRKIRAPAFISKIIIPEAMFRLDPIDLGARLDSIYSILDEGIAAEHPRHVLTQAAFAVSDLKVELVEHGLIPNELDD